MDALEQSAGRKKMIVFDSASDSGIRMSVGEVTPGSLKQTLLNDHEFKDQKLHCEIYKALFWRRDAWTLPNCRSDPENIKGCDEKCN